MSCILLASLRVAVYFSLSNNDNASAVAWSLPAHVSDMYTGRLDLPKQVVYKLQGCVEKAERRGGYGVANLPGDD